MFWIAILGLSLSWMLIKLGILSATVGILTSVVKLMLIPLLASLFAAAWFWYRKKTEGAGDRH